MPSVKNDMRAVALALAVVSSTFAAAQDTPRFSETLDVSLVNVDVVVTDRNGQRVRGLKASDFTILEDGKPRPIANFTEFKAGVENASVAVEGTPAAQPAIAPRRQPRTVLVFVDELALIASKADFRPSIQEVLEKALEPGDVGAIMSWTNRLNVRQGFTRDLDALHQAAGQLPAPGPAFTSDSFFQALREDTAFWESVANDPKNRGIVGDVSPTASLMRQSMATTTWQDTKSKVRALNAAMTSMAGSEGRKILVLVTHRFSRNAGLEYFVDPRYDNSKPYARVGMYDQYYTIASVADTANATGFTIYGLYPEGLRATMDTAANSEAPTAASGPYGGARDHLILMNETESLELVSDRTGGDFAFGTDVLELLPRIADDMTDYYSLAYRTALHGNANRRKISVRLKNRDYRVRTRSEFVERTDSARMKDRVTASVFAAIDEGTIPIRAKLGPETKGTLPLTIEIPINALATTMKNGKQVGAFTVYVAWNASGTVGDATKQTQSFSIDAADLDRAKRSHFTYHFDVRIDRGTRALGIGVLDETSKEYGVLTVPVNSDKEPKPSTGASAL